MGSSPSGQVPNEGLRRVFLENGEPVSTVCMRMGRRTDTTYIERVLGIRREHGSEGFRTTIKEGLAVQLCRAMNADPHEVGF